MSAVLAPTQMQQLILAGQRLQPDSPLYNMAFSFELEGALDIVRFQAAIRTVITENECLRLYLDSADRPRVAEPNRFALRLAEGPGDAVTLEREAAKPMDLHAACFQTSLYRRDDQRHVWYVKKHHLITDGVAFVEFFRQVERAYRGDPLRAVSFDDHLRREAESRAQPRFADLQTFWAERCAKASATAARQRYGNNDTSRHSLVLEPELMKLLERAVTSPPLRAISRNLAVFSVLAATLFVLRYRLFDQAAHTLGMPVHQRTRGNAIGPVLEIGFLDVSPAGAATFAELVAMVQADALTVLKNSAPGISSAAINSSFSWLLNFVTTSFGTFNGLACKTTWLHPGAGDAAHTLRLQAHDFDAVGSMTLHFDLATREFSAAQRDALPRLFVRLLSRCLEDPSRDFRSVSLLEEGEDERIREARGTSGNQPFVGTLELFKAQLERYPDRIAVVDRDRSTSYAELGRRATELAAIFSEWEVVPILAPRGTAAVAAIIGALMAGRPFVPLEVQHPDERINRILDALGNPPIGAAGSSTRPLRCAWQLDLDEPVPSAPANAGVRPGSDTAYIIFTSGTTGAPKGVEVGGPSLTNYVSWAATTYGEGRPLDMPLYSSLAFDLTLTSIFLPLITGGKIRIYGSDPKTSQLAILDVMAEDAVDAVKLTPSHLRLAMRASDHRAPAERRVRTLILGGENLTRDLALQAHESFATPVRIFNEYGPTEATVGCMIHLFDPARDMTASVPIGRPIENSIVEVLDHCGMPVPHGFDGQIMLSGLTLALGYWHGERIAGKPYKTGDRARRGPSGELIYLGRNDNQVKFRGARIELAEVERALEGLPSVHQAHVVVTRAKREAPEVQCERCGIPSSVPRIRIERGVCSVCREFEVKRERVQAYFKDLDTLATELRARQHDRAGVDCLVLASGGKDSSYALCKLVELGFKPVVLTLDNGYLSEHALANVERMTKRLGLEWVRETAPGMKAIFADSLARHSNVCNGCFKTIYTLAVNFALKRGIPSIVTGLSRGQLFETRLLDMLDAEVFDERAIDARVLRARLAYHSMADAVSEHLDVSAVRRPDTFSRVAFFDFYRYCDASLNEMLSFLAEFGAWRRPPDTGRSTNCLINDVGIYVHKKERGHHNYAIPYAWDVRMGHKTRAQALTELNDDINVARVENILAEIRYTPVDTPEESEEQLVAYYTTTAGGQNDGSERLREALMEILPDYAIPTAFVALEEMPLTPSGKVNRSALPPPARGRTSYRPPESALERDLVAIWEDQFKLDRASVHDNFFDLGGDSIAAVQISVAAARLGWRVDPTDCFDHPTIADLATAATRQDVSRAESYGLPEVGLMAGELEGLMKRLET
jgi:amino acid adenylation domain-containing protein